MRSCLLIFLALIFSSAAVAGIQPPPPQYIIDAEQALTAKAGENLMQVNSLLADDVTVFENGKLMATGKEASLKLLMPVMKNTSRQIIGYSGGSGNLLIVDTFDVVDRSNLPPNFFAEPEIASRSSLYQFGDDHLIHFVQISIAMNHWVTPQN